MEKGEGIRKFMNQFIPISEFSRKVSQIVTDVVENKKRYIIVRNNINEAVLISLEEYVDLVEIKEKYKSKNSED